MKQIKFRILCLVFISFLFYFPNAFAYTEDCSTTVFTGGVASLNLTFPAGGGYNTDAKVSLPMAANISATSVDLVPQALTGTPYIWVPQSSGDRIYQIETKTGVIVASSPYGTGSNPSRVTVMPGGDTWVANRNSANLTRLSPAAIPAYSVSGTYLVGSGPRGLTFDYKGNIWAFDYYDNTIWKFTAPAYTSSNFANTSGYPYIYGAIGDSFGYVWMIGDLNNPGTGNRRVNILNTKTNSVLLADSCSIGGSTYIYGIGMDNQGNILVAHYGGGGYCKIGGAKAGANFGKILQTVTQAGIIGSRGVAVDGNNNIWIANSVNQHIYVFSSAGTLLRDLIPGVDFGSIWAPSTVASPWDMIGVAIDFDNNAWVVSNGRGHVIKFGAVGAANQFTVIYDINLGGSLYNYSDMTGFRSIPNALSVGSTEYIPTTGNTYTGFSAPLKAALTTCSCPDTFGVEQCTLDLTETDHCLVPLSLFSVSGGEYEAKNLKIGCSITFPDLLTGFVPCGRLSDDPDTDIIESDPCTICAMFYMLKNVINFVLELAIGFGVFVLVITGLLYALSAGDSRRIEQAKTAIKSTIIGIAIVFTAWLLVAVILQAMGYGNMANWHQITSC